MKFKCPNCELGGCIDDSKLPESGAWATCPRCKEKFHVTNVVPLEFTFSFEQQPPSNFSVPKTYPQKMENDDGNIQSLPEDAQIKAKKQLHKKYIVPLMLILITVLTGFLIYVIMNENKGTAIVAPAQLNNYVAPATPPQYQEKSQEVRSNSQQDTGIGKIDRSIRRMSGEETQTDRIERKLENMQRQQLMDQINTR